MPPKNAFDPKKQKQIGIIVMNEEHKRITDKQKQYGFKTLAEYMRFVSLNAEVEVKVKGERE